MYRLAALNNLGISTGCISPATLRTDTREEMEKIAERYRRTYPLMHFGVIKVDAQGYRVAEGAS